MKQKTPSSTPKNTEQKVRMNRILAIDNAIRSNTYPNCSDLAKLTEVNIRTIQRDIEYLRDMYGAPIEYDALRRGYWYTEESYYIKSVPLSEGELFSVALFNQLLEQYRNTPLENSLRGIFSKIVQCLPENVIVDTTFLSEQMTFIPDHAPKIDLEVFKAIFTALKKSFSINFEYRPLQKTTWMHRSLDPYHAVCQQGSWYVIGYCHTAKEPRMFSLSRMKRITMTSDHFTIPGDFDIHKYFDAEVGVWATKTEPFTVKLLVDKSIATFALERQWHSTQTLTQNDDGSVLVEFTTNQMPEVFRMVMGQGKTVRVLEPPQLVQKVREEIEAMAAMYKNGGGVHYEWN